MQQEQYSLNGAYGNPISNARTVEPIELQVAMLARRSGQTQLEPIEDGSTLRDGGGDPASGDLIKVHFQANCACYVYVIGIDATGYVAQIYPDAEEGHENPVQPNATYLVPGRDDWWALDEYKGIEQVFFLASLQPRDDVQAQLRSMARTQRSVAPANYRPITVAAVIPTTRGLVKVKGEPISVAGPNGTLQNIASSQFSNQDPANEVLISRWFHHE